MESFFQKMQNLKRQQQVMIKLTGTVWDFLPHQIQACHRQLTRPYTISKYKFKILYKLMNLIKNCFLLTLAADEAMVADVDFKKLCFWPLGSVKTAQ